MSKPRRVACPLCKSEAREFPSIVGEVFEHRGRLAWHGFDPRSARAVENADPSKPARHVWVLDITATTEPLRGHCRRRGHGWVSVSTADVTQLALKS